MASSRPSCIASAERDSCNRSGLAEAVCKIPVQAVGDVLQIHYSCS
jgi:hypothetical protein